MSALPRPTKAITTRNGAESGSSISQRPSGAAAGQPRATAAATRATIAVNTAEMRLTQSWARGVRATSTARPPSIGAPGTQRISSESNSVTERP